MTYFQFKDFHVPFMTLQSIGFKFFAKIMGVVFFAVQVILVLPLQATLRTYPGGLVFSFDN